MTADTAKPARAYLLKGDDELQKQEYLDKLLSCLLAPDFADFDLEQMEGDTATADRVISGLHVAPFASQRRVVLMRFANKIPEDEQPKLAAALGKAPESGCLILVNPAADKTEGGKPRKGSEVLGDLSRAVRKLGEVREFRGMKRDGADRLARSIFDEAGKKISPRALAAFVQRVGGHSAILTSEAKKLINYALDADEITLDDVLAVTCETPEEKIFKLVDAIAARNEADALRFLGDVMGAASDADGQAPRTISMIARQFRLIWQARMLAESGVKTFKKEAVPDSVKAALPSEPNVLDVVSRLPWQAKRLSEQARSFTGAELVRCFSTLARADLMLKGIVGDVEDPRTVMELLVIRLARGRD